MPVLSAECKYSTFPTEGSVALLNNTNSGWVPRFGKLSSAKSKKDTRKQFLSFNSTSVALTTEGFFFFFLVKIIKKKIFFLSRVSAHGRNGENKGRMHRECVLTKALYRFVHCCTSPSWSFYVHVEPWDKERAHGWTGCIYAEIPFVHFSGHFGLFPWQKSSFV